MKRYYFHFSLFFCIFFSFQVLAEGTLKKIQIYTYEINGILSRGPASLDPPLLYNSLILDMGEFGKKKNSDLKFLFMPFKRSVKEFLENPNACIFPISEFILQDVYKYKDRLIFSNPVSEIQMNAVSLVNGKKAQNLTDLYEKRLVMLSRFPIPKSFKALTRNIQSVETEKQALHMLKLNRADYFITIADDTIMNLENRDKGILEFDPNLVLVNSSDKLACHNNANGKSIINLFNELF